MKEWWEVVDSEPSHADRGARVMISYRDMTFCVANCNNEKCTRKLTDEIREEAVDWWGNSDAPIAVADFTNSCDKYQKETEDVT